MSSRILVGVAVVAAAAAGYALRPLPQAPSAALELERERAATTQKLEAIADRLDRLDGRLSRPDKGIETLATRMDTLASEIAGTDGTLRGLRDAVARLRKDASRDAALLDRSILRPSVQVVGRGGVGGGTVIRSEAESDGVYGTYIVTAFHVLQKVSEHDPAGPRKPVQVKIYADGGDTETIDSDLLIHDERRDLALLKLRSTKHYPIAARLAARERIRETSVFTPIYAVGCPLGHDPLPSFGEITTLRKEVNGERFWMMSAPTIFGNSGGGVFHRETLEMIGVSAMICTFDNPVSTPVPHLGILVPLDSVYDWLRDNKFAFIFDPTVRPPSSGSSAVPASASAPSDR
ncbi:MAG TPA: trypsin-like peptidase domain-containing protein [Planctomycetota bacterium]|nr:trypsin-like peptidase domain-containing protein [Planctomycetota bacterium]